MESIIVAIITILIYAYIEHKMQKDNVKGKLFFSSWILGLGIFCAIFVLIMLYALLSGSVRAEVGEYLAIGGLLLFFTVGAVYSLLEYRVTKGDYDNLKISFCTPWSCCKKYKYSDITKITYNRSLQWYVLHTKSKTRMRFSVNLTGIDGLLKVLERKKIPYEEKY